MITATPEHVPNAARRGGARHPPLSRSGGAGETNGPEVRPPIGSGEPLSPGERPRGHPHLRTSSVELRKLYQVVCRRRKFVRPPRNQIDTTIDILGIYLAKVFTETKDRPYTIVRRICEPRRMTRPPAEHRR